MLMRDLNPLCLCQKSCYLSSFGSGGFKKNKLCSCSILNCLMFKGTYYSQLMWHKNLFTSQDPGVLTVSSEISENKAGVKFLLSVTWMYAQIRCAPPPRRFRHPLTYKSGISNALLSNRSIYYLSKQPYPSEVHSTCTDNAMNLNPRKIHIFHQGLAAIFKRLSDNILCASVKMHFFYVMIKFLRICKCKKELRILVCIKITLNQR